MKAEEFLLTDIQEYNVQLATITGKVINSSGAPKPAVPVKIKETGAIVYSNSQGRYVLLTMVTGDLTITIDQETLLQPINWIHIPPHHGGVTIQVPDLILD